MDKNAPAFPVNEQCETSFESGSIKMMLPAVKHHLGLSVRDYLAAKAMQGMLAYPGDESNGSWHNNATVHLVASHAYRYADAMLAAREAT